MKIAIKDLLSYKINSADDLTLAKRQTAKKHKIGMILNSEILKYLKNNKLDKKFSDLKSFLKKRSVRTMSGIAPVAVLTKPYPCPGKCAYCPTEKNVPQSYLSNEPAVMRAIRCGYNPYIQVQDRLRALEANGHEPTKIELIVIGGTWSYLPTKYKYWYINECFRAANDYPKNKGLQKISGSKVCELKKSLQREQKRNEKTKYNIVGLTLETRPDYINKKEILEMRELGATRVELGVQAVDEKILAKNKRGHGIKEIADATKLLKDYGFKITYHLMPGLPGSTAKKDLQLFEKLFSDSKYQPDQIKFYPTVVTKGSELYKWWKKGDYKPLAGKALENLIIKCKKVTPRYVRIIRLIRDIPGESIIAGNLVTNLRQVMKDRDAKCNCIRCREIKNDGSKISPDDLNLNTIVYPASDGTEYFVSFEGKRNHKLYGFCRLRISPNSPLQAAIIRELHVYGELVPKGALKKVQHSGLGKLLLKEAERLAKDNNYDKISIISGVGIRNYYCKLGYKLNKTYLTKNL